MRTCTRTHTCTHACVHTNSEVLMGRSLTDLERFVYKAGKTSIDHAGAE